jgi:hypothetical protein
MSKYDEWISNMICIKPKPSTTISTNSNEDNIRTLYNTELDPNLEESYTFMHEKVYDIVVPIDKDKVIEDCLKRVNLIRKEMDKKRVIQQVRAYDNKNNHPNSRWIDYMESEVAPEDQNEVLDDKMDNIFVKNLEIGKTELKKINIDISDELDESDQTILKKQNETAVNRQIEFDKIKAKVVKSVQEYDNNKKKDDSKYEGLDFSQDDSDNIAIQKEFSNLQDKIDMAALRNDQKISIGGSQGLQNLDFY